MMSSSMPLMWTAFHPSWNGFANITDIILSIL